jgi:hypothetical protein
MPFLYQVRVAPMANRLVIKIALWFTALSITLLVFWMSSTFGLFTYPTPETPSNYALLAEGFLQGQLSLNATPAPELLAIPNPYDPETRGYAPFIWDASLYNQRYYIYFGPVPALLFYLPSELLLKHQLTDDVAIFILTFAVVGALFAAWHLVGTRLLQVKPPGGLLPWLLYAAYGTSLSLQLGGGMYVVAALSAMLFQILTIFLLVRYISSQQPRPLTAFLAGVAAVAATGSRPTHAMIALFGGLVLAAWAGKQKSIKLLSRSVLAFGLPVFLGGLGLALYNYLRFDNIFEFGLSYQLGLADFTQNSLCAVRNLFEHPELLSIQTWYLLAQHPYIRDEFPYVSFRRYPPKDFIPIEVDYIGADAVTGLLAVSPLILPGLLATLIYWRFFPSQARLIFAMCALIAVSTLSYLYTCSFAAARYLFEIISVATVISIPALWFACQRGRRRWARVAWRGITCLGLGVGIFLGFVGALDGHFKKGPAVRALLRGADPAQAYEKEISSDYPPTALEEWLEERIIKHLVPSYPSNQLFPTTEDTPIF